MSHPGLGPPESAHEEEKVLSMAGKYPFKQAQLIAAQYCEYPKNYGRQESTVVYSLVLEPLSSLIGKVS